MVCWLTCPLMPAATTLAGLALLKARSCRPGEEAVTLPAPVATLKDCTSACTTGCWVTA